MAEGDATEGLRKIKHVFDEYGITFWLDSGALLGAARSGRMIEWDMDVDFGAWYDCMDKFLSVLHPLMEMGFRVSLRQRHGLLMIMKGHTHVDVFLFRKTDGYAWSLTRSKKKMELLLSWCIYAMGLDTHWKPEGRAVIRKTGVVFRPLPLRLRCFLENVAWSIMCKCNCVTTWMMPRRYFEKLSTIRFHGMKFCSPSNLEDYLEYRYGCNWRIPNKDWSIQDDGAVRLGRAYRPRL